MSPPAVAGGVGWFQEHISHVLEMWPVQAEERGQERGLPYSWGREDTSTDEACSSLGSCSTGTVPVWRVQEKLTEEKPNSAATFFCKGQSVWGISTFSNWLAREVNFVFWTVLLILPFCIKWWIAYIYWGNVRLLIANSGFWYPGVCCHLCWNLLVSLGRWCSVPHATEHRRLVLRFQNFPVE